jgi:tRNA nucleotidyltransferase (CCA-adding enzyme)
LVDRLDDEFGEFSIPDILTFKQALSWVLYLMNLPENEIDSIGLRLAFPALLTKAVKGASVLGRNLSSSVQSKPSYWTFHLDDIPPLGVLAVYLIRREQALKDYLTTWRHVKPYTTGYTLQQRGLQPGPRYKEILSRLRVAWLDGEIQTEDEEMRLLGSLLR